MIAFIASHLLLLLSYLGTTKSFTAKPLFISQLKSAQLNLVIGNQRCRNFLRKQYSQRALQENVRTTSATLRSTTLVEEIDQSTPRASLKDLIRQSTKQDRAGIVIIAGFEAFNVQLYRKAAALVM